MTTGNAVAISGIVDVAIVPGMHGCRDYRSAIIRARVLQSIWMGRI